MRLACTVATYPTKFGPIIFKDGNLKENFQIMHRYGFTGVDLFVNETSPEKLREYRCMLDDNGIHVATFLAIFLSENGVRLSETDPARRIKNLDLVKKQLDNARFFDADGLAMGFIRGGYDEKTEHKADALKRIGEALEELGEYAASIGTNILLEPINRYEINTINSAVEGEDFIRQYELKGVGLLLDAFHMNIEDKSLGDSIRYARDHIINLHVADSNRHALSEGHLDVREVLQALKDIDFQGHVTLEAFSSDPEEALRKTRHVLQNIGSELGISFGA